MLICPKCKIKYEEGHSICSNCGTQLTEEFEEIEKNANDRKTDYFNWLKGFGNITAQRAITILFCLGIIPLFISSIMYGKHIYLTNKYIKNLYYGDPSYYQQIEVNNLPLGIFLGIVYFIVGILIWKIACELLIIIFRCFETYVKKNSQ